MINCAYCGRENEAARIYCHECATILPGKVVVPVLTEPQKKRAEARETARLRREQAQREDEQREFQRLTQGVKFRRCPCNGVMVVEQVRYRPSGFNFPYATYGYICPKCQRKVNIASTHKLVSCLIGGVFSAASFIWLLSGAFNEVARRDKSGLVLSFCGILLLIYAIHGWQEIKAHPRVEPEELPPDHPYFSPGVYGATVNRGGETKTPKNP